MNTYEVVGVCTCGESWVSERDAGDGSYDLAIDRLMQTRKDHAEQARHPFPTTVGLVKVPG